MTFLVKKGKNLSDHSTFTCVESTIGKKRKHTEGNRLKSVIKRYQESLFLSELS